MPSNRDAPRIEGSCEQSDREWIVTVLPEARDLFARLRWIPGVALVVAVAYAASNIGFRPPLTTSIPLWSLPLGWMGREEVPSEELLSGSGGFELFGIGGLFLLLAITGAYWVYRRPETIGAVVGALLAASIAVFSAACFNHPLLIEELDLQFLERSRINSLLIKLDEQSVTNSSNARIGPSPLLKGAPGALQAGIAYLFLSTWMIAVFAMLFLAIQRGAPSNRLKQLAAWISLGVLLSGAVCSKRLLAEMHWYAAVRQEQAGSFEKAAQSLRAATSAFPALASLQRIWYLAGKLDVRRNLSTPQQQFYLAVKSSQASQPQKAILLLEELMSGTAYETHAARNMMAEILEGLGQDRLTEQQFIEARALFQRSVESAQNRYMPLVFVGYIDSVFLRARPDSVSASFEKLRMHWVDRALRADMAATLADAHFDHGNMQDARELYRESLRAYELPKRINYRARRGLLGL